MTVKRTLYRSAFEHSEPMRSVRRIVDNVAPTDVTVLVWGETGVGKEVVAWALHEGSPRRERPFVKVNCAALPLELLESELFGYERGAFTGASRPKPGKFEQAHTGTIFLDEVGEMPLPIQAKLLQVLQDRQFSRLGSRADIKVDVRVLAATNKDLGQLVARKEFREDLYYRLNVINLYVPALRTRTEEIPILTERLLDLYAQEYGRPKRRLSGATLERLLTYPWPGNVRELENILTRIVVLDTEEWVGAELTERYQSLVRSGSVEPLHKDVRVPDPPVSVETVTPMVEARAADTGRGLKAVVERAAKAAERAELDRALGRTRWRRVEAARQLQISYRTLLRKIGEHGLMVVLWAMTIE
jgi:two-component system, NtrC family, response regulator AtoC